MHARGRLSLPAALCAVALLVLALSAAGCSQTCDYGFQGSEGSGQCAPRPDPSAKEKDGYRAASLTPRFEDLRASKEAGDGVETITVNRWGEIGAKRDSDWVWTENVDGKPIDKQQSLTAIGEGDETLDPDDADPRAIERAMEAIRRRSPDAEFVAGAFALAHPRVTVGVVDVTEYELRWTVTTKEGDDFAYYETDRRGRPRCVISSTDGSGACRDL